MSDVSDTHQIFSKILNSEAAEIWEPSSNTIMDIDNKIKNINTSLSSIVNSQTFLLQNQRLIMENLANITTKFEEFMKKTSESLSTNKSHQQEPEFSLKPITNKKSLDEFEESLKNQQKMLETKNLLSVVCGKGKGRAISNAYALIDALFSREFLVGCSWSGGTRTEGTKICFKTYQNTINLFFELVHVSDKSFTKLECEEFLKGVLRNSKKRYLSKNVRISSQKKRQSKQKCALQITDVVSYSEEAMQTEETSNDIFYSEIKSDFPSDDLCVNIKVETLDLC